MEGEDDNKECNDNEEYEEIFWIFVPWGVSTMETKNTEMYLLTRQLS